MNNHAKSIITAAGGFALLAWTPVAAEEIEYEPSEGYHEEEWYDPSDWFNDDGLIDYETDPSFADYWGGVDFYDDLDYAAADDLEYGPYYRWDSTAAEWQRDYGYHLDEYDYVVINYAAPLTSQSSSVGTTGETEPSDFAEGVRTLAGTLQGFRQLRVSEKEGQDTRRTVIKLRLEDGRNTVVALGSPKQLKTLDLEKGDVIALTGRLGTIDDRNAVFADYIAVDGQSYRVLQRNDQGESVIVSGKVASVETAREAEATADDAGAVLQLKFENGITRHVRLNKGQTAESLGLSKDRNVLVEGSIVGSSEFPYLIDADRIEVDGAAQKQDKDEVGMR